VTVLRKLSDRENKSLWLRSQINGAEHTVANYRSWPMGGEHLQGLKDVIQTWRTELAELERLEDQRRQAERERNERRS
jgi:hypothetical protein